VSAKAFIMDGENGISPDRLNAIGVLKRREIEARLLIPLLDALGEEFGRERVLAITRQVIVDIARHQGAQLARRLGGYSLEQFVESLAEWQVDDALQIEIQEATESKLSFDVTHCRYAEMYQQLGIPELGTLLSCNRDQALIEGFNEQVSLTRTQTIMEGAPYCDFRYLLHEGE
jgi:predicted ArsR family transcriptional regulator